MATSTIDEWVTWQNSHPFNLEGALHTADLLIEAGRLDEAVDVLEQVNEVSSDLRGQDAPAIKLAGIHRLMDDVERERDVLAAYSERDGSALAVYRRLAEIDTEREDWDAVLDDWAQVWSARQQVTVTENSDQSGAFSSLFEMADEFAAGRLSIADARRRVRAALAAQGVGR